MALQPLLQVEIFCPHQGGISFKTLALIDTGAHYIAIPEYLATLIGHDVRGQSLSSGQVIRTISMGTAGGKTKGYFHKCVIDPDFPDEFVQNSRNVVV